MKKFVFPVEFQSSLFRKVQFNYKPASVQVMAWRQTGVKPIPEPMLTLFIDAYMRH